MSTLLRVIQEDSWPELKIIGAKVEIRGLNLTFQR